MSFIAPIYKCDHCCSVAAAQWTGEPHWDVPDGWAEHYDPDANRHYCEDCMRPCGCGQCGGLPSWECAKDRRS